MSSAIFAASRPFAHNFQTPAALVMKLSLETKPISTSRHRSFPSLNCRSSSCYPVKIQATEYTTDFANGSSADAQSVELRFTFGLQMLMCNRDVTEVQRRCDIR